MWWRPDLQRGQVREEVVTDEEAQEHPVIDGTLDVGGRKRRGEY